MKQQSIAAIKRYRTRRLASMATSCYYLHKRGRDEEMATLLCDGFVALGGVYIKFLQGILLRSKFLAKWQSPDRLKIFENLESEHLDVVEVLRHELKPELLARITMVQPEPFAAGSFGQVYYGQLSNGQPIIIKVLRPGVRELLRYDLRLLSTFSKRFFAKLYRNMNLQLDDALKEFRDATLKETDYRQEAQFAHEMYVAYKDHKKFLVPQTYLDLCTDDIIVQDYVPGVSVAQIIKLKEQGYDPSDYVFDTLGSNLDNQLSTLGYESIVGVFHLDRIQGDPHPGNVRLLSEDRVGLIDFGISAKAPNEKAAFFGMMEAYDSLFKGSQTAMVMFEQAIRFFVSDLYRALKKMAKVYGKDQGKDYMSEVSAVAAQAFAEVSGTDIIEGNFVEDGSALQAINGIVNKGNRFGLVMRLESSELLRAIQTYTSLVSSLGRYQAVMPTLMDKVVTDVKRLYPQKLVDTDDTISIGDAIETIMNWLERVAERDPALFRQLMDKIKFNASMPNVKSAAKKEQPANA